MLQAIQDTTLTGVHVKRLSIREKEMEYWANTFKTMASQSAMLAGFCYSGLSLSASDDGLFTSFASFGYLITCTAGLSFGLITIIISALTSIFGPGLALRGKDG